MPVNTSCCFFHAGLHFCVYADAAGRDTHAALTELTADMPVCCEQKATGCCGDMYQPTYPHDSVRVVLVTPWIGHNTRLLQVRDWCCSYFATCRPPTTAGVSTAIRETHSRSLWLFRAIAFAGIRSRYARVAGQAL